MHSGAEIGDFLPVSIVGDTANLTELLRQIQQLYENNDSIILLPVGEDMLNSLQCIGQSFNLELITAPKNTIFV